MLVVLILVVGGIILLSSPWKTGAPPPQETDVEDTEFHEERTYTNSAHGYSLRYPGWWMLEEGAQATVMMDPTGTATVSIVVIEDPLLQDPRGGDALIALHQERLLSDRTLYLEAFRRAQWDVLPAYRATGVTKTDERFVEEGLVTGGKLVVMRSAIQRPYEAAFAGSFELIRESFALTSADDP